MIIPRLAALIALASSPVTIVVAAGDAPALKELEGVWRADFNADSSKIVVQMRAGTIGLWDAVSGSPVSGELGTLAVRGAYVIDRAARQALIAFEEGGCRIFALADGRAVSPRLDIKLPLSSGALPAFFSPDGATVVLLEKSGAGHVLRVADGRQVAPLVLAPCPEDREILTFVSFSKDGKKALILDGTGALHRYDTATWQETGPTMPHPFLQGYSIGFAASEDHAWAVTWDTPGENGPKGNLQLWEVTHSRAAGTPLSAQNGLTGQFLNAGQRLLLRPDRGATRVVKIPSLETDYTLPVHDDVQGSFARPTPDHDKILTWGYDGRLCPATIIIALSDN